LSRDEANDVIQQALLQAIENFSSLDDLTKFKPWLFKFITNVFYNSVKRNFWKRFLPLDDNPVDIPEVYSNSVDTEKRNLLYEALTVLNEKEKSALLLFEIAGFSIEEIAGIQNEKSDSAVKSRLSRARKKLRNKIEKLEKNKFEKNKSSKILTGDLENETFKLISEFESRK
jgi:RNA polymerase sigma-70 factor (ECF subfamily)